MRKGRRAPTLRKPLCPIAAQIVNNNCQELRLLGKLAGFHGERLADYLIIRGKALNDRERLRADFWRDLGKRQAAVEPDQGRIRRRLFERGVLGRLGAVDHRDFRRWLVSIRYTSVTRPTEKRKTDLAGGAN